MATYRDASGAEVLVCDGCGITPDGTKPDLSALTKFDFTAEMRAAGFPEGTALNVLDHCPACQKREGH